MIMETRSLRMKSNDILKNIAEKKNFSDKVLSWLQKNEEYLSTNLEYTEYHKDVTSLNPAEIQASKASLSAAPKINNNSKLEEILSSESSVETAKYILSNQKTKRKRQTTNIRVKVKQFNSINDNDSGNREEMKLIKSSKLSKSSNDNNNKYPAKNLRRKNEVLDGKCNVDDNIGRELRKLRRKMEPIEEKYNSSKIYKESKVKLKKRRLKRQTKCDSSTISQKYNLKTYKRNLVCDWDLE